MMSVSRIKSAKTIAAGLWGYLREAPKEERRLARRSPSGGIAHMSVTKHADGSFSVRIEKLLVEGRKISATAADRAWAQAEAAELWIDAYDDAIG
jgi:hypothetical protein